MAAVSTRRCRVGRFRHNAGNIECVQALVDAGADVSIAAEGGVTSLHAAAELGALLLVQLLLQVLPAVLKRRTRKVYAVRRHNRSPQTWEQPGLPTVLAAVLCCQYSFTV